MARRETITPFTSFRPHNDTYGDYETIRDWCELNNSNFSCIFNSFLPAIAYALTHHVFKHGAKRYLRADFGDILIREKMNQNYV